MQDTSFEKLAADAAAGLKADREVYRDVTQELHSFLEDKAERYRREAHSDEESIALAKKAFGSPMEVASELLNANRGRLRLRALLRIGFNALIIPLAVLLALYVGYGRFARLQNMNAWLTNVSTSNPTMELPTLPFLGIETDLVSNDTKLVGQLYGTSKNAEAIRRYWETHRNAPDSHMFYAYFAVFDSPREEAQYVSDMRLGEQIEPQNALYNILLSDYYLRRGVLSKEDNRQNDRQSPGDLLLDRRALDLGLVEMRKAAAKPYLHTYQMEIVRKKLDSLSHPLLTEDYLNRVSISAAELFPEYARFRNVARRNAAAARILAGEGHKVEAEAAMYTWKPYALLLSRDSNTHLIGSLVSYAVASLLAKDGAQVYQQLGAHAKAREAQATYERLRDFKAAWNADRRKNSAFFKVDLKQHGSMYASVLFPVFPVSNGAPPLTDRELTPSRMHEHVLYEETGVGVLQILLALFLLGTVLQGIIWHYRLRGAASVPLLLLPPAREILRILWWGLALPILIYAVYSRLPIVGGREYGWGFLWWRFSAELLVLGLLVLWLPSRMINRCVRRRCEDLDIPMPPVREETTISRKVRGMVYGAIVLAVIVVSLPVADTPELFKLIGILFALVLVVTGVQYAASKRRDCGLYYGTLARSMAPLYAFAIILLAVTVQPLLLSREAAWLRKDTLMFGQMNNPNVPTACTGLETRVAQDYSRQLLQVLERK